MGSIQLLRCSLNEVRIHGTAQWFSKLATPRQGHGRAVGHDRWATSLGYRLCVKPRYARAPATGTPSQLAQNGMLKPPISTDHPKMIRSRCIIAITRNSMAVTII